MKKNTIIIILLVVLLFGAAFLVSSIANKSYLKEITYEEYQKLINEEKEKYIYVGDLSSVKMSLNDLGKTENKKDENAYVYYLNPNELTDEERKEVYENDTLYHYSKNDSVVANKLYLTEVDIDEYLKIIKSKGYHFMFIGSSTCGYCTKFKEEIRKMQLFYNVDIYYLDLNNIDQSKLEAIYETDDVFTTEEWGTPLNLLYKDGKRINILNGYVSSDELINFLHTNGVIDE